MYLKIILLALLLVLLAVNVVPEEEETSFLPINYQTNRMDLEDGKFAQTSSLGFENYKDGEEFKPIDMTLIDYGTYWKTTESVYYPTIPKYSNEWFEFRNVYEGNDHTIRTRPITDKVFGVLNKTDNKIVYENAFGDGIDLEVYPYNSHLLKQIVINKLQIEDLYFDFELEIDNKLDYKSVDNEGLKTIINSVSLESAINLKEKLIEFEEDKSPTIIYPMRVWDSNNSVEYIESKIYEDNGKMYLRKVVSKEFLEKAVYPVYTDDDTGATSPGTMADDDAIGSYAWSNPDNAKVLDESNAVFSAFSPGYSHYLNATNFGFSIPEGQQIDGIFIEIFRDEGGGIYDNLVYIIKADSSLGSENKARPEIWPGTQAYADYGAVDDLWSESWTADDINNANFGVAFSAEADCSFCGGGVDHIQITVYYSEAPTDTCSPTSPLSADHTFLGSDNCVLSSDLDAGGYTVNCVGTGTLNLNAVISNFDNVFIHTGCNLFCRNTPSCFE